jgi:hypothetical protein
MRLSKTARSMAMLIGASLAIGSAAQSPGARALAGPQLTTGGKFLTPLSSSLFLSADDPRVRSTCRDKTRCARFLKYGSDAAGPGPFIPPVVQAEAPNLLITFTLETIQNEPVSGEGIGYNGVDPGFDFYIDSAVVTDEWPNNGPLDANVISVGEIVYPGQTVDVNAVVWQGLVPDGCNNPPPVIPIEFRNRIMVPAPFYEEAGEYLASDNTSLVSTGFWNFQYTMSATAPLPHGTSHFTMRGKVSVICSGLQEL